MMDDNFYKKLSNNINFIIVNNNVLCGGIFDIRKYVSKYSSNKEMCYRLFFNENEIKTKGVQVNYKCDNCGKEITMLLKKYLLKTNFHCRCCKEDDIDKRKRQSEYMKQTYFLNKKIIPKNKIEKIKLNNIEFIDTSNIEFEKENIEFKENYYKRHINLDQFVKIKKDIFSINNHILSNNLIFYEHLKTNNQIKYSNYVYDKENDILINFNNIKYKCENCDEIFRTTRKPIERINNLKCFCKGCSFSNKTFKIKNIKNIIGNKILYQSFPELKLIEYCNNNKILIENGPKIDYIFNNKLRKYSIDYYIPNLNMLIEIKDEHIWHKRQVNSGKWRSKEKSAEDYANENNLVYKLIFSDKLDEFILEYIKQM